ncbi:hypothetical protein [Yoonia sp.]|uniref:hypothetical protein n=1 Tax=Yoonia sp. TaxID=2212373 RepID=UPI001A0BFADA|nr:hypothetical protein [Yoonia sp.]MBE0412406.1 hypothetical protein [Yoonia sp.]
MTDDSQTQTSAKTKTESRKPLWVYLKQCAAYSWLSIRALWPLWFGIFALVAVWSVLFILGCREKDIRLLGMLLQLGGFLTVAKGLRDSGRLFQKPTFRERIAIYFKGFPRPSATNHFRSAHISKKAMIETKRIVVLSGPNTPLENRVEKLEEITKSLFGEVGELGGNLRAQSDELTLKITEEVTQRKAGHRAFEEQLERAVIGGIHVDWWGVILFIAGIILASASPELAGMLGNAGNCR